MFIRSALFTKIDQLNAKILEFQTRNNEFISQYDNLLNLNQQNQDSNKNLRGAKSGVNNDEFYLGDHEQKAQLNMKVSSEENN